MTAFDRILDALRDHGSKVDERNGRDAHAQCPAHDDNGPSLHITGIEGQTLIHCFAQCDPDDVLAALNLSRRDLFDEPAGAAYQYVDTTGELLRTVRRSPDKRFTQQVHDKSRVVLYRLPEVLQAVRDGRAVWLVEGEKDVHTLEAIGEVATTAPQGSQSFKKVDVTPLKGATVYAVIDNDEAGEKWASMVAATVGPIAQLSFFTAAHGKDVSDHLMAGGTLDTLTRAEIEVSKPSRRAHITWADTIDPEPVVWAWEDDGEGRIPSGSLSVAAGREGTGKSSFGIWLAAQIAAGALPGSFHGKPRRVFYVAVEDSWKYTLVPRLIAAGADRSMVGRFEVVDDVDEQVEMSLPADNNLLEEAIVKNEVGLVVIDPLMSVIGSRIDTHREREVRTALDPLARIADRTGAVVLGIAHFNKSSSGDPASLITGSGAFKNVPRSVFGFARDDDDESGGRILSQVKNSLGRDDLPNLAYRIDSALVETPKGPAVTGKFTLLGESDKSVSDVLRAGFGPDAEDRNEAQQFVLDYLFDRTPPEAPAGDVLKAGRAAGFSDQSLKDARRRSKNPKIQSAKSDFGSGWVWMIDPEGGDQGGEGGKEQEPAPFATYVPPSPDPATTNGTEPDADVDLFGDPLPKIPRTDGKCDDCGNPLHKDRCVRCEVEGRRSA